MDEGAVDVEADGGVPFDPEHVLGSDVLGAEGDVDDGAAGVPGAGLQGARGLVRAEHRPRLARAAERDGEAGVLERSSAEGAREFERSAGADGCGGSQPGAVDGCGAAGERRRPAGPAPDRPARGDTGAVELGAHERGQHDLAAGGVRHVRADARRARTEMRRRGVRRRSGRHGEGHDRSTGRRPSAGVAEGIRRRDAVVVGGVRGEPRQLGAVRRREARGLERRRHRAGGRSVLHLRGRRFARRPHDLGRGAAGHGGARPGEGGRRRVDPVGRGVAAAGRGEHRIADALHDLRLVRHRAAPARDRLERPRASLRGEHRLESVGTAARREGEGHGSTGASQVRERRGVASVGPFQQLLGRDDRDAASLRGGDDGVVVGAGVAAVRVQVRDEGPVVPLVDGAVHECHRGGGVGLPGLIRQLRRSLVDVQKCTVQREEALRHRRAGEHPGSSRGPGGGPVVVVRVEVDAGLLLLLGNRRVVDPEDAVVAAGVRRRDARVVPRQCCELLGEHRREFVALGVVALGVRVQRELEALLLVRAGLGIRDQRVVDELVRRRPDAVPSGHRAARRAPPELGGEPVRHRTAVVLIGGHDDRGDLAAREVPESRDGQHVTGGLRDEVRQEPLLLVRLRDSDLRRVDVVVVEEIIRPNRGDSVALLAQPCRIALARVDHRSSQIEGEGGRRASGGPDAPQRHRRELGGGRGRAVQLRHHLGAAVPRAIEVGGAVELHRRGLDARARPGRPVHLDVALGETAADEVQPEEVGQGSRRAHHDQVAAGGHPVGQCRHLRGGEGGLAEHHGLIRCQCGRRERRGRAHREQVEALGSDDLGQVGRVLAGALDEQERPAGTDVGIGTRAGARDRGERPGVLLDHRVPGDVGHASRAAPEGDGVLGAVHQRGDGIDHG